MLTISQQFAAFFFLCLLFQFPVGSFQQQQPGSSSRSRCGADGWSLFRGNCFKVFASEADYSQAQQLCQSVGATLASIHSAEENAFVAKMAADQFDLCQQFCTPKKTDKLHSERFEQQPIFRSFWIGLRREAVTPGDSSKYECRWDDGSVCDYGREERSSSLEVLLNRLDSPNFPWSVGQPSGNGYWKTGLPEPCVHFWWKTGWWNDVDCGVRTAGAICEKKALPC